MKAFLVSGLILLASRSAPAQSIASGVYAWDKAPLVKQSGFGDRILLEGATRDFTHLSVRAITLFAGQPAQPMQQPDEETLIIMKEGALTVQLGNRQKVLGPGSIVVIMPGDGFRLENKTTAPLTYYLMQYTSNEMPDLDLYRLMGESFWIDRNDVPIQANDAGGTRRLFDHGTIMTKRLDLQETTLRAGMPHHPPHTHRAAELLILMDNGAEEQINHEWQTAKEGDVIFLESDVPHHLRNNGPKNGTYFVVQL